MNNPQWVTDLFASIDAMDSTKFVSFIDDGGTFTFANNPTMNGREAIFAMVDGFFKSIKAIHHTNLQTYITADGATVFTSGTVDYTRHSGSHLVVNFCNRFNMKGEKIFNYDIFIDNSTLYAE